MTYYFGKEKSVKQSIVLRSETKLGEQRTPLTPKDAQTLIDLGINVLVERSSTRIYGDESYRSCGCELVDAGYWRSVKEDMYILGLKELPIDNSPIASTHIFFSHSYKGQIEAEQVLDRFRRGEGKILDLEFLANSAGYRSAAFGFWAGYVGAALGILAYVARHEHKDPMQVIPSFSNRVELISLVSETIERRDKIKTPKVIVIGAKGRCGKGATQLLDDVGLLGATLWDIAETANRTTFPEILEHDIFINTILLKESIAPFLSREMIQNALTLSVVVDVSCDPNNPLNPVQIYDAITTMDEPVRDVGFNGKYLDVIAIDHLPSLLPKESSDDFSAQLLPCLTKLFQKGVVDEWASAEIAFNKAKQQMF